MTNQYKPILRSSNLRRISVTLGYLRIAELLVLSLLSSLFVVIISNLENEWKTRDTVGSRAARAFRIRILGSNLCVIYIVSPKNTTLVLGITSANVYRSSKFFYCWTQQRICSKIIVIFFTVLYCTIPDYLKDTALSLSYFEKQLKTFLFSRY